LEVDEKMLCDREKEVVTHTRGEDTQEGRGFKKRGGETKKRQREKMSQGDGRKITELRVSKLKFVVQGSQERGRDDQQCDEEGKRGNTRKGGDR
jgi:hypothetical protein